MVNKPLVVLVLLATFSKDIIPSEEDTVYWSPKEHSLLIWSLSFVAIPGEMSQFSESFCVFVTLLFKEMSLCSCIILGCLVFRYKETDSRRKNYLKFWFKKKKVCLWRFSARGWSHSPYTRRELSFVNSWRYSLYFTSEIFKIYEKALVISINQTQCFPFLGATREKRYF